MTSPAERLTSALADRYRIERELGAGGMATVYLAHDVRHDRKVALKLLRPELAAILGGERFLKEIRTTANLQHPHILSLFDSGEADGLVFYVMPNVEGESLRDRLVREHQLPVDDAIRITKEVASALDYAHRHGVVHRDIKPENILLHDGQALVADFGIALAASRSEGGTRMTETGMSLGTPHYMSPEQAMGEREITAKSDVYALGCVLYEMLTGEPPFTGPTAQAIVARVMTEEPRSITLQRRTVPPNVEAAALTALAKLPADRFASAAQFAEALGSAAFVGAAVTRGPATAVRGSRIPNFTRARTGVLAAAAILLVGAAFLLGKRSAAGDVKPLAMQIVPGPDHRLGGEWAGNVAVSPDGETIAYVAQSQGLTGRQIYVRRLDAFESTPVPGTEDVFSDPVFLPDGKGLVWLEWTGAVRRASLTGGATVLVGQAGFLGCCTLQADPTGIFYVSWHGLERMPLSGGPGRVLGQLPVGSAGVALPGGRTFVYVNVVGAKRVQLLDLASGKSTPLEGVPDGIDDVSFADGYLLLQSGNTLSAVKMTGTRVRGEIVPLLQSVRLGASGGFRESQSAAAGGTLAFVPATGNNRIALVDRTGRETLIPDTTGTFHRPRFSPDGRRISVDISRTQSRDVWVYDMDQHTMTRVTFERNGHDAIWAPDGRSLYYSAAVNDSALGLMTRRTDGSTDVDTVMQAVEFQAPEAVTAGGQVLAYATGATTDADAWLVDRSKGTHRVLLGGAYAETGLALSSDGRLLAYASNESGRPEIYVRALEGGPRLQVSTGGGREAVWNPRGGELFFRVQATGGARLVSARIATGPLRVVARDTMFSVTDYEEADPHANFAVSPDGQRFVFIRQQMPNEIRVIRNWPALLAGK
ncbi:MAG: protein kinase [Gemmatimonadales bacterium]